MREQGLYLLTKVHANCFRPIVHYNGRRSDDEMAAFKMGKNVSGVING